MYNIIKDILLCCIVLLAAVIGYFYVKAIDRFLEENRKAQQREEKNEIQEKDIR